jgi:hypothetical protein
MHENIVGKKEIDAGVGNGLEIAAASEDELDISDSLLSAPLFGSIEHLPGNIEDKEFGGMFGQVNGPLSAARTDLKNGCIRTNQGTDESCQEKILTLSPRPDGVPFIAKVLVVLPILGVPIPAVLVPIPGIAVFVGHARLGWR